MVSVNETRLCAKLTVYSIAYNIYIYAKVTKHSETALASTPIQHATSVCCAWVLRSHIDIGYWMCQITSEYMELIDESLSGVTRFVTLVKPLDNAMLLLPSTQSGPNP